MDKYRKKFLIERSIGIKYQWNLLELFAGSRSIGKRAEKMGFNVFSVDWKRYPNIDLAIDIEELTPDHIPFIPGVIWASPDCTTYSTIQVSYHRDGITPKTEYARKCDSVNLNFINLIKHYLTINPSLYFFIENPRAMMRHMPFVKDFYRVTVWYCQYGSDYAKPTDIFTNCGVWTPRPPCFSGNPECHHIPSRDEEGKRGGIISVKDSFISSQIPEELCMEILNSIKPK